MHRPCHTAPRLAGNDGLPLPVLRSACPAIASRERDAKFHGLGPFRRRQCIAYPDAGVAESILSPRDGYSGCRHAAASSPPRAHRRSNRITEARRGMAANRPKPRRGDRRTACFRHHSLLRFSPTVSRLDQLPNLCSASSFKRERNRSLPLSAFSPATSIVPFSAKATAALLDLGRRRRAALAAPSSAPASASSASLASYFFSRSSQ
ncbi:hypothetical protein NL676_000477 [Syzygium grande]|nr:hypothetical protein NL676_000477 [Syzygium grande]